MTTKRYRDHAVDMDRDVAALDSDAVQATVRAMRNGLARGQGLSTRPQSAVSQLCDQLSAQFPKEIDDFKRGTPLPGARLAVMVEHVTGHKPTVGELGNVRRQLTRQYRGGLSAAKLRRDHAAGPPTVAKRLDIRHGVIYSADSEKELEAAFPNFKRIKKSR